MGSTQRGLLIFIGIVAFVSIVCGFVPFVWMAGTGAVAALPVIEVPGEKLVEGFFFGQWNLTNTITATFVADLLVIIFAVLAWRVSKGWTNEVPGRFQVWVETIIGGLYGITKDFAGDSAKVKNILFPVIGSIFIFLLAANWMALLPGVDTVGIKHCAHGKQAGYPLIGSRLYNDTPLNAGISVTAEEEAACYDVVTYGKYEVPTFNPAEAEMVNDIADAMNTGVVSFALAGEMGFIEEGAEVVEDDGHGGEAVDGVELTDEMRTELRSEYAELSGYELPIYYLSADELEGGVLPYSVVVTPFLRPAATDLNLTLGLAIFAFFIIQYFGVSTLGLDYFQKFINLRALGELDKNPIGGIDFVVGLFEIISEFAKVISLAFRLFGNIFAGMVLIFVMHFLLAIAFPVIFYGLETIIGLAQALVFAVLTLIFAAQAMVSHHHDDEHGEAHH